MYFLVFSFIFAIQLWFSFSFPFPFSFSFSDPLFFPLVSLEKSPFFSGVGAGGVASGLDFTFAFTESSLSACKYDRADCAGVGSTEYERDIADSSTCVITSPAVAEDEADGRRAFAKVLDFFGGDVGVWGVGMGDTGTGDIGGGLEGTTGDSGIGTAAWSCEETVEADFFFFGFFFFFFLGSGWTWSASSSSTSSTVVL
jgi:hypothetical protein